MGRQVSIIIGTRPEAIKLAPVVLRFQAEDSVDCRVCVTGQHRQMLDPVLQLFGLQPDTDLDLMRPNQSLAALSARALARLDQYLEAEKPDLVLVQGDTTTAFCAGLAAFYQRIPFGHVEAGLRTGDLQAPWPEEANRVLTSRLATLHFAPTESARRNLLREGVSDSAVTVTGNTVIDALFIALAQVRAHPPRIAGLPDFLQPCQPGATRNPRMVLITGHRRENFGAGLENICSAIAELAQRFPDVQFVYPVHLNPNVREPVMRLLGANCATEPASPSRSCAANIHLIDPLSYLSFVGLMDRATLILTDSGGVQEEAPSLGKPVLVMREITERPEAVAAGTVRLVGTDREEIVNGVSKLLADSAAYGVMARAHNPYGDGQAAGRIVKVCRSFLWNGLRQSEFPKTELDSTSAGDRSHLNREITSK
jgi:UDP-N-acetylglucosamine 2-epimerase (non-hydrolysing)